MAVVALQTTRLSSLTTVLLHKWEGLTTDDTGAPLELPDYGDLTVQIIGAFGGTGSVSIEGSNDGANWAVLTDPQGNAITKTAAAMELITETPRYIRPNVTLDTTPDIDVLLLARRGSR